MWDMFGAGFFDVISAPQLPSNDIIGHLARACCTRTRPNFAISSTATLTYVYRLYMRLTESVAGCSTPNVVARGLSVRYWPYQNCFLCRGSISENCDCCRGSPETTRKQEAATCFLIIDYYWLLLLQHFSNVNFQFSHN